MRKESLKDVLEEVKDETLRFLKKLEECKDRMKSESLEITTYGYQITTTRQNASVRRAGLDLKNELTRITQSTIY